MKRQTQIKTDLNEGLEGRKNGFIVFCGDGHRRRR